MNQKPETNFHDDDEMDIIMSQFDTNVFVVDGNGELLEGTGENMETEKIADFEEMDEMDDIMSQMDDENLEQKDGDTMRPEIPQQMALSEGFDKVDEMMSQMDIEILEQEHDVAIPPEILTQYQVAMEGIDDKMIHQAELEDDAELEGDGELDIPEELLASYEKAMGEILPRKSGNRYLYAYEAFRKWQESNGTRSFDEKVIMAYFCCAAEKYVPTTLWSMYSMLKKTILVKQNIDLAKYCRLRAFLKTKSDGYESKKSNVFETEDINRFIVEAPNRIYLAMKVVLIFGLNGTCRGCELTDLTVKNIEDRGNEIIVTIPNTKTKVSKKYYICDEFTKYVRDYMQHRPSKTKTDRLFLQWRNGKCVNQVMGKHSIAKIPKEVAKFLNLPEPASYTGHSYRRTSATVAVDEGATVEELKRMGPWKSTKVCESYIQNSKRYKRNIARKFTSAINLPSTSEIGSVPQINPVSKSVGSSSQVAVFGVDKTTIINDNVKPAPTTVSPSSKVAISGAEKTSVNDVDDDVDPISMNSSSSSPIPSDIMRDSQNIGSRKKVTPISINFESASQLMISGGGKSITISGAGKSDTLQTGIQTSSKENIIFHFGGECSNFTIINMK